MTDRFSMLAGRLRNKRRNSSKFSLEPALNTMPMLPACLSPHTAVCRFFFFKPERSKNAPILVRVFSNKLIEAVLSLYHFQKIFLRKDGYIQFLCFFQFGRTHLVAGQNVSGFGGNGREVFPPVAFNKALQSLAWTAKNAAHQKR